MIEHLSLHQMEQSGSRVVHRLIEPHRAYDRVGSTLPGQGSELQLRRRKAAGQPADQRAGSAGRHIQHRAGGRPDLPAQVVRRRAGRCAQGPTAVVGDARNVRGM